MLQNKAYATGKVIDEVTFARVQRIRADAQPERMATRWPWPLVGTLSCYCGRKMRGMCCGKASHRIRYYACNAHWNHDSPQRLVRADNLEAQFIELLGQLSTSPRLVEQYRRQSVDIPPKELEKEARKLRTRAAAIAKEREGVWALHNAGKIRADDIQERLDALADQKRELEASIAKLQEQIALGNAAYRHDRDAEAILSRAADTFAQANVDEQRRIARAVEIELGGIVVEEDGRLNVRRVEPKRQRRAHVDGK
jgi:hypothetical protein